MKKPTFEVLVGLFMIAGIAALIFLAFKVSGLTEYGNGDYYVIYAEFDNIGDLKTRAPITVGGVRIGKVGNIVLDPSTFRAKVSLNINNNYRNIPTDSSASIFTQGLLGSNYISITPGFSNVVMKTGGMIENTRSALILENLIGQLLVSFTNKDNNSSSKK